MIHFLLNFFYYTNLHAKNFEHVWHIFQIQWYLSDLVFANCVSTPALLFKEVIWEAET